MRPLSSLARRSRAGVVPVLALVLLTACTPAPGPAPTTDPSSTSTASAGPSAAPVERPVVAFGGDCAAVLADADTADVFGVPAVLREPRWSAGNETQLGGIICQWRSSDPADNLRVSVVAYPREVVAEEVRAASPEDSCDEEQRWCSASATVGDVWIRASAQQYSPHTLDPGRLAADLLAWASERTEGMEAPLPVEDRAGWWQIPSCEELAEGLRRRGIDRAVDADRAGSSSDPVLRDQGLRRVCELVAVVDGVRAPGAGLEVQLHSGAGASGMASARAAEGTAAVEWRGEVFLLAPDPGEGVADVLVGSDGVNLAVASVGTPSDETLALLAGILEVMSAYR